MASVRNRRCCVLLGRTKIYIKNNQNFLKIGFRFKRLARRCCNMVLKVENFHKKAEISILFVDDEQIRILNQKHRNQNRSTDVLSFPLKDDRGFEVGENGVIILGDIVVSIPTAIVQAAENGHSIKKELEFLIIHSMLHLLGYDHESSEVDCKIMRQKEKLILLKL